MKRILRIFVFSVAAFGSVDALAAGLLLHDVLNKSYEAYASLSNYSDTGTFWQNSGSEPLAINFSIKLARPILYRIDWTYPSSKRNLAWNSGSGSFLAEDVGDAESRDAVQAKAKGKKLDDLSLDFGISQVPELFYKTFAFSGPLQKPMSNEEQLPDDKTENVDCYVFTATWQGRKIKIWIGKSDYLIRRLMTTKPHDTKTSDSFRAAWEKAGHKYKLPPPERLVNPIDSITVETHANVLVNQNLAPADFLP